MSTPVGLHVYRHETLPPLAHALADTLTHTRQPDPLTQTIVAIPSFAVARWLTDQLAKDNDTATGHVANLATPFPGGLIDAVLAAVLHDDATGAYTPERLTWTILSLLRENVATECAYTPLARQLDTGGSRSGVAFARHSAHLLDRYIRYRPELLDRWHDGDDTDQNGRPLAPHLAWQPVLWRAVNQRVTDSPPHVRRRDAIRMLTTEPTESLTGLHPASYNLFGVHGLQTSDLDVLVALAKHRAVNLFLLTPSRTWDATGDPQPDNPSLDVFTRHAQAQHREVARALTGHTVTDLDDTHSAPTALGVIQQHLKNDRVPALNLRHVVTENDNSIQIHACQGIVRECDAVKDTLLKLLDADDTLELRDIAILTPDINQIAPLLAGVLSDGDQQHSNERNFPRLSYAIRDRSVAKANPLAETIVALYTLAASRVSLNDISDLVHRDTIATQLRLTDDDITTVIDLLRDAGVRWGIDGQHRQAVSQNPDPSGSFAAGFDRIIVGLAVPNAGDRVLYDVAPYAALAADDMHRFLTVYTFLNDLFTRVVTWREPRALGAWIDETVRLFDTVLSAPADAYERHSETDTIVKILTELADDANDNQNQAVSLTEFIDVFDRACAKHGVATHDDTGITVSSLLGLRSLPFRIVCLLGMNDAALARATSDVVHDLIATQPDVNDTTARDETRQFVFDALINTTQHLIVTYTATDPRTGEPKPNARILDDLNELLDTHLAAPNSQSAAEHLTVTHPRQLTHPAYYDPGTPLWRSDRAGLALAKNVHRRHDQTSSDGPLPARFARPSPPLQDTQIGLQRLAASLKDPTRTYLARHGINVVSDDDVPDDRDLFTLAGLNRWAVYDAAMNWANDDTLDQFIDALTYRGLLPTGTFGTLAQEDLAGFVAALRAQRNQLADTPTRIPIDLSLGTGTLVGDVTVYGNTIVRYDASENPTKTELALWIDMLVASITTETAHRGIVIHRHKTGVATKQFEAPSASDSCAAFLDTIVGLHQQAQTAPLPFFARTSQAYAKKMIAGGAPVDEAIKAAKNQWDSFQGFGEKTQETVRYVYGIDMPFERIAADERFHQYATEIFYPLLSVEVKGS